MSRYVVTLAKPDDFDAWRCIARQLCVHGIAPCDVVWRCAEPDLFGGGDVVVQTGIEPALSSRSDGITPFVPPDFLGLCRTVNTHRDPGRFCLLYRLLWRLQRERGLLDMLTDVDVAEAMRMVRNVRRDIHKMHAFVRFRQVDDDSASDGVRYLAWFEPSHFIVPAATPFFARRFPNTHWAIFTPDCCAFWDRQTLAFGPGACRDDVPADDAHEALWRTYYRHIFNPARLKVAMMQSEMPKKYWHNLPEASVIEALIGTAEAQTADMLARPGTTPGTIARVLMSRCSR